MKLLLPLLILISVRCEAQDTVYVSSKSDVRLIDYQWALRDYKNFPTHSKRVKDLLVGCKAIAEYERIVDSLAKNPSQWYNYVEEWRTIVKIFSREGTREYRIGRVKKPDPVVIYKPLIKPVTMVDTVATKKVNVIYTTKNIKGEVTTDSVKKYIVPASYNTLTNNSAGSGSK